jgi:hypothetical protein
MSRFITVSENVNIEIDLHDYEDEIREEFKLLDNGNCSLCHDILEVVEDMILKQKIDKETMEKLRFGIKHKLEAKYWKDPSHNLKTYVGI